MLLNTPIAGLAAVSSAIVPLRVRDACSQDACLSEVTGNPTGANDCNSFFQPTSTSMVPVPTVTITVEPKAFANVAARLVGKREPQAGNTPAGVPTYASACDAQAYSSACSCLVSQYHPGTTSTTAPATTTPVTDSTTTLTNTQTVTVTVPSGFPTKPTPTTGQECLTQEQVDYFIAAFVDLLEYTNTSSGFNLPLAQTLLANNFTQTSDSASFLAHKQLNTSTFSSQSSFSTYQSAQYPVLASTLSTWLGCKFFVWRYSLTTGMGGDLPVQGISVFEISDDLNLIQKLYTEFDSAAWAVNLGILLGKNGNSDVATVAGSTGKASQRMKKRHNWAKHGYLMM